VSNVHEDVEIPDDDVVGNEDHGVLHPPAALGGIKGNPQIELTAVSVDKIGAVSPDKSRSDEQNNSHNDDTPRSAHFSPSRFFPATFRCTPLAGLFLSIGIIKETAPECQGKKTTKDNAWGKILRGRVLKDAPPKKKKITCRRSFATD